ncbi:hypothetical protein F5878DRAFT_645858 [Lentinula raphanica]|uniref:Uncharacterized protein n=1 Tax=Lentinula raphanica TaxID=153919 RepID=A0AA38U8G2_9AGAR|nr:hypothetical protein F5878DRAFT_645858 [Lentinula raphanica]
MNQRLQCQHDPSQTSFIFRSSSTPDQSGLFIIEARIRRIDTDTVGDHDDQGGGGEVTAVAADERVRGSRANRQQWRRRRSMKPTRWTFLNLRRLELVRSTLAVIEVEVNQVKVKAEVKVEVTSVASEERVREGAVPRGSSGVAFGVGSQNLPSLSLYLLLCLCSSLSSLLIFIYLYDVAEDEEDEVEGSLEVSRWKADVDVGDDGGDDGGGEVTAITSAAADVCVRGSRAKRPQWRRRRSMKKVGCGRYVLFKLGSLFGWNMAFQHCFDIDMQGRGQGHRVAVRVRGAMPRGSSGAARGVVGQNLCSYGGCKKGMREENEGVDHTPRIYIAKRQQWQWLRSMKLKPSFVLRSYNLRRPVRLLMTLTLTEAQTLLAFLSSSTPVQLPAELATLSARLQTQLSSTRATSNPSLGTRENCQLLPVDSGAGSPTPDVPQSLQPPDDLMSDDYVWNPLSSTPSPMSNDYIAKRLPSPQCLSSPQPSCGVVWCGVVLRVWQSDDQTEETTKRDEVGLLFLSN